MNYLHIEPAKTDYRPGEVVTGTAGWEFDNAPAAVEVRLFWFTRGKGTVDAGIVGKARFDQPLARDTKRFELRLPNAPYSFSGSIISLIWAIELVAEPSSETALAEITVSPTGSEILLPKIETEEDRVKAKWEKRLGATIATNSQ